MRGAIVGLGTIGKGHLRAYARQEQLEIVALVDPLGPRDAVAVDRRLTNVPCYESVEQLLASTTLDFIDICSPPHKHLEYTRAALSRGLHVLCEKPILHSDADVDALCETVNKASTLLFPSHNYRFAPGILRVRELLGSPAFGALEELHFRTRRVGNARGIADWLPDWRVRAPISGGGILRDHGPHSFYVMRFLTGLVPVEVSCMTGHLGSGPVQPPGFTRVEDTAIARVRFDGGVEAQLELTWGANRRETIYQFRGRGQTVRLTDDDIVVIGDTRSSERVVSDFNDVTHSAWFTALLAEFAEAARDNSAQVRATAAARAVQESLDVAAAYRSARSGGEWTPVEEATTYLSAAVRQTPATAVAGPAVPRQRRGPVGHAATAATQAAPPKPAAHAGFAMCDWWTRRAAQRDARGWTRPDIVPNDETGATVYPRYFGRAEGAYLWDVDGNRYVDYLLGYGPVILGHNNPRVIQAVVNEFACGVSIAPLWSPRQVELTELLTTVIPGAESAYLLKTGSDANSAAVRLSRIFTGRDRVVRWGYNGWHDWAAGNPAGVPAATRADTLMFDLHDPGSLRAVFERHPGEIACVLTMPFEYRTIRPEVLAEVRAITHEHGALLVFDEMRSGFRMSLGGAQEYFGVRADLVTLSKAMANGHPISAVTGRADVMECLGRTRISSTFYASPIEMAAASRTIEILRDTPALEQVWSVGAMLQDGLRDLVAEFDVPAEVMGYPPSSFLRFLPGHEEQSRRFHVDVVQRGILLHPDHQWFVSAAHTPEDIEMTLDACRAALAVSTAVKV
jgi:glutamate-1-semialdehyde 2,1-aminomutase